MRRKLNSTDVIDVLTDLFIRRGGLAFIRSDNGPPLIAQAVQDWISTIGAKTACIAPDHLGKMVTVTASTLARAMKCWTGWCFTASKTRKY